jgi:pimeloyl-ACP methyl ester carboxylesterase
MRTARKRSNPPPVAYRRPASDDTSAWARFACDEFSVAGRACCVVRPFEVSEARPWIWRTEFFGAFASLDVALLDLGYHVAYIDIQNLYGAPKAVRYMDAFHADVTARYELASQVTLEGFSRGALSALNWAARRAHEVQCLYLDAPVCDFKSWPAGMRTAAGGAEEWQRVLAAYELSESQALAYPSAMEQLLSLANARVPIIAVYGDADLDVPPERNILLLQSRYQALGGPIHLICKPGAGHHPLSLEDPRPLVEFIIHHTQF